MVAPVCTAHLRSIENGGGGRIGHREFVWSALTPARYCSEMSERGERSLGFWYDHVAIVVPSSRTPLIQEAHDIIMHVICEAIDRRRPRS